MLEAGTHAAQQWRFRRKSETYAIWPAAPLAFSNCDSAIAAAVRGGGYVRSLCIEAEQQVAAGLLLPVLTDWNDASQPVVVVHALSPASEEALAFRTFIASILPWHVTGMERRADVTHARHGGGCNSPQVNAREFEPRSAWRFAI